MGGGLSSVSEVRELGLALRLGLAELELGVN